MKKFSKMLTLGLALAMAFGMTVSAKNSPTAPDNSGSGNNIPWYNTYGIDGKVHGYPVDPDSDYYKGGVQAADTEVSKDAVKQVFGDGVTVKKVLNVYNLWLADEEHHTVQLDAESIGKVEHYQAVAFLHYPNGYGSTPEVVWCYPDVDEDGNFCYSARLTGGSPYVLVLLENQEGVELSTGGFFAYPAGDPMFGQAQGSVPTVAAPGTSPKTGETLPVAGMMAVLCLAGALVCIKKASYNA